MNRENFAKLTERMTHEGRVAFTRRAMIGARCIEAAHGRAVTNDEDRETAATDAISDVLSALYGPPSGRRDGEEAALLDRALRSYWGDYEDYLPDLDEMEADALNVSERVARPRGHGINE